MTLVALAMMLVYDHAIGTRAWSDTLAELSSPTASLTPGQCSAGNLFSFENHNSYPIWLGEFVGNGPASIVVPPKGWKMDSGTTVDLCTTPPFSSGRFWARTECDFEGLYQSGTQTSPTTRTVPFATCNADTDCPANPDGNTYDCLGGVCMVDCTSTGKNTNDFCQGEMGKPGNTNAICSNNTGATFNVCTYSTGLVCKTGDCGGLLQCEGSWTNGGVATSMTVTGSPPASLFEPTSTSASVVNYDVSNVSGYNDEIRVNVSPQLSADAAFPNNCYEPKCVSDLNDSCPLNLQVTEAPTTTKGPVKCGGGLYCSSGACQPCTAGSGQSCDANNKNTCVVGCNDPGDQCASGAANGANLSCSSTIPSGKNWTADGSSYFDMYQSTNESGNVDSGHIGTSMSSQNQGNPTCWTDPTFANANIDCAPDQVCDTTDFSTLGFPAGVGVCVYKKSDTPTGDTGGLAPQINCGAAAMPGGVGDACGGYYTAATPPLYPSAIGYTCNSATITVGGHKSSSTLACLPAFGTSAVAGIGSYLTPMVETPPQAPLFSGTGSELNPEWLAAAKWATGNGTKAGKPFYEYFSKACPHAYAWTYDDNAGGLSCNSSAPGGNSANVNFTIAFGPKVILPPTPTPTATTALTPTATATATSAFTPTATATATSAFTPTATATSTATVSATATRTFSPTVTATGTTAFTPTMTATATSAVTPTATATSTATITPSPGATPICAPNVFLGSNPSGTVAFGVVPIKSKVSLPVTMTNNEPAGFLNLSAKISSGNANDFAITGGTCRKTPKLSFGQSCTYQVQFTGYKRDAGTNVGSQLIITGTFGPKVCPAGDMQSLTVTLAGAVAAASP